MSSRNHHAIAALRSLASAIDNAEAVAVPNLPGARIGVGVGDVQRRRLSPSDVDQIVAAEIAERDEAASQYDRFGQVEKAAALRAQISVLEQFRHSPAPD